MPESLIGSGNNFLFHLFRLTYFPHPDFKGHVAGRRLRCLSVLENNVELDSHNNMLPTYTHYSDFFCAFYVAVTWGGNHSGAIHLTKP